MLSDQLEKIVMAEEDIIPFLKNLDDKQKRELVPFLKKFHKKIFESREVHEKVDGYTRFSYENLYSTEKREMVDFCCFVCMTKTDANRTCFSLSNLCVDDFIINNVLDWYVPKWYNDVINAEPPWSMDYEKMMMLYDKELLFPSISLILSKLPQAIVRRERKNENTRSINTYSPEALFLHKETLKTHIWYLFEEDSGINNYYGFLGIENYNNGNDIWIDTIINLVKENKIDRNRVLTATILSSTKGFNKNLSGWFFDLLIQLNPSEEELLLHQDELFTALYSPHSKVVNTVLKYFKAIGKDKKFKYEEFIDTSTVLLSSETKSVVSSTLMILDKVAKVHKVSKSDVCLKSAEALMNVDEKIQERASKIIVGHGNVKNEALRNEINMYAESAFHSAKLLLKDYIITQEIEIEIEEENNLYKKSKKLIPENAIPNYETFDELVFLVSQAIDNNEVYHIDLFLDCLPRLNAQVTEENVSKLEPIFKRSWDLSVNLEWSSRHGHLEVEVAYLINDLATIYSEKYPEIFDRYLKHKNKKIKALKEETYNKDYYKECLKEFEDRGIQDYIFHIHNVLFRKIKSLINENVSIGLLSTPTHIPCWVDPLIFIDRIVEYENKKQQICIYDFQIGIGRFPYNEMPESIKEKIDEIGDCDIKNVLKYHFGLLDLDSVNLKRPDLWLQSVLSKNNAKDLDYFKRSFNDSFVKEFAEYDWDCSIKEKVYDHYNYKTGKYEKKSYYQNELRLKDYVPSKTESTSFLGGLKEIFKGKKKVTSSLVNSIYDYMYFKKQKYSIIIPEHDEVKFLLLAPNNPSVFLNEIIRSILHLSTFTSESEKRNVTNLLKGLYEIWTRKDFSESTYLFLATGMLCSEKVSRELAAEIWIKAVSEDIMNNDLIGICIGKLQHGEYSPMKRFTDLLSNNCLNISKKHNRALFEVLDKVIGEINENPPKGVKKLVEIFVELKMQLMEKEISETTIENLEKWRSKKSLKPVINKLF